MQKKQRNARLAWILSASAIAASATFTACSEDAVEPSSANVAQTSNDAKADDADVIPGQYIVVLKDGAIEVNNSEPYTEKIKKVKALGQGILKARGASADALGFAYGHALKGFSARLSAAEAKALREDARVAYVEADRVISLGKPGGGGTTQPAQVTPYGIARVGTADGTGKTAWVIDTGIDLDHPDLNVDVARSKSFLTSGANYASPDDGNGHGTHVSGTIAAKSNTIGVVGVAANATVVAVRVLDARGSGSNSGVIAGVDYVGANGKAGDVANMSLGGGVSQALDDAVLRASANGVLFALAAGNETDDANNHSPARVNGANIYTISAMNSTDSWASFSNFGTPVDYCMPGVNIQSTWLNGGYNTISGTSMATPHMAGVLLLKGKSFTTSGTVKNDPDGKADPIAHL